MRKLQKFSDEDLNHLQEIVSLGHDAMERDPEGAIKWALKDFSMRLSDSIDNERALRREIDRARQWAEERTEDAI